MIINKEFKKWFVVSAYNVLSRASFDRLTAHERISCVKILRVLKNIAVEYDDYKDELVKRLRPSDMDEIERTRKLLIGMTDADRNTKLQDANIRRQIADYDEFLNAVDFGLHDFNNADITLQYEPLSEDVVIKLLESNPSWNAANTEFVYGIVSGERE